MPLKSKIRLARFKGQRQYANLGEVFTKSRPALKQAADYLYDKDILDYGSGASDLHTAN